MDVLGVDLGSVFKVVLDIGGLSNTVANTFKTIREALALGKGKGDAQINAAIAAGEDQLAELNKRVTNLNAFCLEAQDRALTLFNRVTDDSKIISDLREQLEKSTAFNDAKNSFRSETLEKNSFAYKRYTDDGIPEPGYYCPNCFSNRKYCLLTYKEPIPYADKYECSICRTQAFVHRDDGDAVMIAPRRNIFDGY